MTEAEKEYLRGLIDWDRFIYDLSHLPVIWDDDIARVLGDDEQGWRGATPEEIGRIGQVIIEAMLARWRSP